MSSCETWEFEHEWAPVAPVLQDRRRLEGRGPWKHVPAGQRDGLEELRCSACGECKLERKPEPSSTY